MVEFHVLKCAECSTFQVLQVTKTNKWKCKLCGIKQSVQKVFGRGTGAECRHHVQRLNTMKGHMEENLSDLRLQQASCITVLDHQSNLRKEVNENIYDQPQVHNSRWSQFVEDDKVDEIPALADDDFDTIDGVSSALTVTTQWSDVLKSRGKGKRRNLKRKQLVDSPYGKERIEVHQFTSSSSSSKEAQDKHFHGYLNSNKSDRNLPTCKRKHFIGNNTTHTLSKPSQLLNNFDTDSFVPKSSSSFINSNNVYNVQDRVSTGCLNSNDPVKSKKVKRQSIRASSKWGAFLQEEDSGDESEENESDFVSGDITTTTQNGSLYVPTMEARHSFNTNHQLTNSITGVTGGKKSKCSLNNDMFINVVPVTVNERPLGVENGAGKPKYQPQTLPTGGDIVFELGFNLDEDL